MRSQTLIWTALPNGRYNSDFLKLSVFLSPRLTTDEGGAAPELSLFPDFVNWPATIAAAPGGPIAFSVAFNGGNPIRVRLPTVSPLSPDRWQAVFSPSATRVDPYTFQDFSSAPVHSYSVTQVQSYVANLYGTVGATSPTAPPIASVSESGHVTVTSPAALGPTFSSLVSAAGAREGAFKDLRDYYDRGKHDDAYVPATPTFDFHQGVAALGSYPQLLRQFGLVFDLLVPAPTSVGSTFTVQVFATWQSAFLGGSQATVNVSPFTMATLAGGFRAVPKPGSTDYVNGMLDTSPTSAISVTDLDVDGAGFSMRQASQDLINLNLFQQKLAPTQTGALVATTLPQLRSSGPTLVRTGWASAFTALTTSQTLAQQALENTLAGTPGASLPTFYAQDLVRGHRVDVYTASEQLPAWRSLHARVGSYAFGAAPALSEQLVDEGFIGPAATTPAGIQGGPVPDLYVHEALARWTGWSLSAPRPGNQIDPDDSIGPNRKNPMATTTDAHGMITPQLSASFTPVAGSLPKLRFGNSYQYRARMVDLAGNGPDASSTDGSTATARAVHYRYEPVAAPVVVPTGPLGPGQGVLVAAVLNDLVNPPVATGRWLFPPKVAELMVEEHGMLDGFVAGSAPDPTKPPQGDQPTYELIAGAGGVVGMAEATVANLSGVQFDASNRQAPYLPAGMVSTPWFADPLSAGAALGNLPTDGPIPTVRTWAGGPWPKLGPVLLTLQAGATSSHHFTPASTVAAATETVQLAPADVFDLRLSSALTDPSLLGVWSWITGQLSPAQVPSYQNNALRGQLWQLTPYRVLRILHAVRLPLTPPTFHTLSVVDRQVGAHTAGLADPMLAIDARSTGTFEVEAAWADPLDDPADPHNDPTISTVTVRSHAFSVTVPDPHARQPLTELGAVVVPQAPWPFATAPGVVHDLGDTKHHLVAYTAKGTSRFAEFFKRSLTRAFPGGAAIVVSKLGLEATSVTLTDHLGSVVDPGQYVIDPIAGSITVKSTSTYAGQDLTATFEPTVSLTGSTAKVHVLSSTRPAAPLVDRVVPAWSITRPAKPVKATGKASYQRTGGFLRVYLNRPWFSSGAGELLGVVCVSRDQVSTAPLSDLRAHLATQVGLDPITLADASLYTTTTPRSFSGLVTLPTVPGRTYASPPAVQLAEDPANHYEVYPYPVEYDATAKQWYADVRLTFTAGQTPPPGYFVRLALARFQPFSIPGVETSQVVLATFAQPVADRSVSVVQIGASNLRVSVSGPSMRGWRAAGAPGNNPSEVQDWLNQDAPTPYSGGGGSPQTSTMVVEVQFQNLSGGLSGDLAWQSWPKMAPIRMSAGLVGGSATWSAGLKTPVPIASVTKLRLRISELELTQSPQQVPSTIDTQSRRPFVAFIPLN